MILGCIVFTWLDTMIEAGSISRNVGYSGSESTKRLTKYYKSLPGGVRIDFRLSSKKAQQAHPPDGFEG